MEDHGFGTAKAGNTPHLVLARNTTQEVMRRLRLLGLLPFWKKKQASLEAVVHAAVREAIVRASDETRARIASGMRSNPPPAPAAAPVVSSSTSRADRPHTASYYRRSDDDDGYPSAMHTAATQTLFTHYTPGPAAAVATDCRASDFATDSCRSDSFGGNDSSSSDSSCPVSQSD